MKKQIKKSELRKLVKEHLSSFMPGVAPLGAMGNATLQDSLDKAAQKFLEMKKRRMLLMM